jgi:AcrR family transcriptional regulator
MTTVTPATATATTTATATPAATPAPASSARERLLAAADELFYEEGIHTVGIDRIIEQAGVAKATLYSLFGSKDGLIRAYLQARLERRVAAGTRARGLRRPRKLHRRA